MTETGEFVKAGHRVSVGMPEHGTYPSSMVLRITGITSRQLNYWHDIGLVESSVVSASGSGSRRLYSFADIAMFTIAKRLLDTGVALNNIGAVIDHLAARNLHELTDITLFCDGATVHAAPSAGGLPEALLGGNGFFGITIGALIHELRNALVEALTDPSPSGRARRRNDPRTGRWVWEKCDATTTYHSLED